MSDPPSQQVQEAGEEATQRVQEATDAARTAVNHRRTTKQTSKKRAKERLGQAESAAKSVTESMEDRLLKRTCDDGDDVCIAAYGSAEGSGVVYYGENGTFYDVDLTATLSVFEAHVDEPVPDSTDKVLPPKADGVPGRLKLVELPKEMDPPPMPGFSYELGDPDASHTKPGYGLPFAAGETYDCSQGFNDSDGTHDGMNAVDFEMPTGTIVTAARGGVVVAVGRGRRDSWTVKMRHSDGTYGLYAHLTPNGERVSVGDAVATGDELAESGNSGQSTGPHLHFHVAKADGTGGWETVPWRLDGGAITVDGNDPSSDRGKPEAGATYGRPE